MVSSDNNNRAQISELAFGENDHYFSTGKDDGGVIIFKMGTGKQHHKLYTHSSSVSVIEMAWPRNQRYFTSVDDSGRLIVKRLEKPANQQAKWRIFPLFDFRLDITVEQLLFSSSEKFLLVLSGPLDRVCSAVPRRSRNYFKSLVMMRYPGDGYNIRKVLKSSSELKAKNRHCTDGAILRRNPLARTTSTSALNTLEHVIFIQDRYLILEFLSNNRSPFGTSPLTSRHLEVDLSDAELRRIYLPLLASGVNRLVVVTHSQLVFLDHQYWVCIWDINGGDTNEYTKHLFLFKDCLSLEL